MSHYIELRIEEGNRRRDEAIARVDNNADDDWKRHAWSAMLNIRSARPRFTTDAVWALLEARKVPPPHEPRAMGAVMRRAASAGLIEATNETVKSTRPDCHRRDVRIWQTITPGSTA